MEVINNRIGGTRLDNRFNQDKTDFHHHRGMIKVYGKHVGFGLQVKRTLVPYSAKGAA